MSRLSKQEVKTIEQTGSVMLRNSLTAFTMVFPAELPDKSMFATLVLTSRFRRPGWVWVGVIGAFAVHVVVAVAAGSLINRLPDRLVGAATALLFAVGAMLLWRESGVPVAELDRGDQTAGATPARLRTVVVTSFVTVGLAEWGDLTQLATASLAADRGDSYGVGIGAFVALATVAGLAAFVGRSILRVVSLQTVRRLAAGLFGALAIWTLFELF